MANRKIRRPIFIVGCNNSGTSMLTTALLCHSQLCGTPLMEYPDDLGQRHHVEIQDLPEMPRIAKHHLGKCTFRAWGCGEFKSAYYLTEDDYTPYVARTIRKVLGQFSQEGKRLLFKTPSNVLRARMYQAVFPDADFIGVYRNGYAVTEGTCRKRNLDRERPQFAGLRITIVQAATNWNNANTILLSQATTYLKRCLLISYESLVEQPKQTLHRVLDFLELPQYGFPIPSFRTDLNDIQISRLTPEQIEQVTENAWPMLRHFGYPILNPIPDRKRIQAAGLA